MATPQNVTIDVTTTMNGVPMALLPFHVIAKQAATEDCSGLAHHLFVFARDEADAINRVKRAIEGSDLYDSFVVEKSYEVPLQVSQEGERSHVYKI